MCQIAVRYLLPVNMNYRLGLWEYRITTRDRMACSFRLIVFIYSLPRILPRIMDLPGRLKGIGTPPCTNLAGRLPKPLQTRFCDAIEGAGSSRAMRADPLVPSTDGMGYNYIRQLPISTPNSARSTWRCCIGRKPAMPRGFKVLGTIRDKNPNTFPRARCSPKSIETGWAYKHPHRIASCVTFALLFRCSGAQPWEFWRWRVIN
ncbi:hypothetical protein F4861DRAFT_470282 [Xylaria intraflava]|nr:hypothetical protein F4861DRAFT_470282 [Xylaria intraflava]